MSNKQLLSNSYCLPLSHLNHVAISNPDAKQKHPGCKKVRGQSEAALQTGATKNFDIS